jgi:hypothetical protein
MHRLLLLISLLFATPAIAQSYIGPCDLAGVTCAEAWSLDYAMTNSYRGPLFQIAKIVARPQHSISAASERALAGHVRDRRHSKPI